MENTIPERSIKEWLSGSYPKSETVKKNDTAINKDSANDNTNGESLFKLVNYGICISGVLTTLLLCPALS